MSELARRASPRKSVGDRANGMLPPGDHLLWSFSTRGMAPEARVVALRGLRERGTLPIEPLPGSVAQAEISRWAFGDIGIVSGKLGGLRQVVPPQAREYRDEVFLGVNIAGAAVASQRGQEVILQTGDAVLFSNAEIGFTSSRPRPSQFLDDQFHESCHLYKGGFILVFGFPHMSRVPTRERDEKSWQRGGGRLSCRLEKLIRRS